MEGPTQLLLALFVIFVSAKLAAELFERLRQPAIVGEILAGVVIGPSVLGLVSPTEVTSALSEIGVLFLLFFVGLETKPSSIARVGGRALVVAVLGVVVPFVAGYALLSLWGRSWIEAIFVGAAMVATSVGITARVLRQKGVLGAISSRIILGAAVIDDVLGLLILAVVSSLAEGGVDSVRIATTAALALTFTLMIAWAGPWAVGKVRRRGGRLERDESWLAFGLSICLGLALLAEMIGVAAIIGAFLAGMALSEAAEGTALPRQAGAVTEFMLPFFLTGIGMHLDLGVFVAPGVLALAAAVTILAVLTKLVGCGLGAWGLGKHRALQVGMGMVPRGEVGIVVAQIGLGLGAVTNATYGVVLFMAVATTLIAPPFIVRLFRDEPVSRPS